MDKIMTFEIIKQLGVISESPTGWKKELNIVKWGDREPKYDIRDWDEEHMRMSRGITLHKEEAIKLSELLAEIQRG